MKLSILKELVRSTLENVETTGFPPTISESNTSFGTSFYIQDEYSKIRISDHQVTNFDRMMTEEHFSIYNLNIEDLKETIEKLFSEKYVSLGFYNGKESYVNFRKKVLKSDISNWKIAKVWFQEEQTIPLKLEDIKNWNVLELKDFTKKGDKRFCKVLRNKFSFGVKNMETSEVIKTRFSLFCEPQVEVCL